jgi:Uri superfamily endonuclease
VNSQRTTGEVKGSYILLIGLSEEQTIPVGSLRTVHFAAGHYAYIGSAMGGLKSRLSRHLRTDKKPHWHIDYLLKKATVDNIITCETTERVECTIARALSTQFDSVAGFGCSDCHCHSHLFFSAEGMKSNIMAILDSLGMESKMAKVPESEE